MSHHRLNEPCQTNNRNQITYFVILVAKKFTKSLNKLKKQKRVFFLSSLYVPCFLCLSFLSLQPLLMADDFSIRPPPHLPNPPLNLAQFPPLPSSPSPPPPRFQFGTQSTLSSPWAPAPGNGVSLTVYSTYPNQDTTHYSSGLTAKSSHLTLKRSDDVTMQDATVASVFIIQEATSDSFPDLQDLNTTTAIEASSSTNQNTVKKASTAVLSTSPSIPPLAQILEPETPQSTILPPLPIVQSPSHHASPIQPKTLIPYIPL